MTDVQPGFSGILRLTDLNDFIAPSQECIKPVSIEKSEEIGSSINIGYDGSYTEISKTGIKTRLKPAKITLNDCLACSGCVTSAETVLIQQQSVEQLMDVLNENLKTNAKKRLVVVSVSPQSRASFGAKYDLTPSKTTSKLTAFLKNIGVDYVFDTTFARHLTLLAEQNEFVDRFRRSNDNPKLKKEILPMLSSSCPGWICYAEKSHGEWLLSNISKVRSPQAIMGGLVKDYFAKNLGLLPEDIFHVTVMPCFDKKLEASRKDFTVAGHESVREVDCVISTAELDALVSDKISSLSLAGSVQQDSTWFSTVDEQGGVVSHSGGGSGGYAEHVFRYAAATLFNIDDPDVTFTVTKNKDLRELTLKQGDDILLQVATCYGFRNIQNVVQRIRRGRCAYHYVEIMACPSGCLNGGGQIRADSFDCDQNEIALKVAKHYHDAVHVDVRRNEDVRNLIEKWLGDLESEKAQRLLYTQYHAVEKAALSLGIKW